MREPEDTPVDVRADVTEPVWYWVLVSDALTDPASEYYVAEDMWQQAGLRLLEAAPYEPRDGMSRWWRIADSYAGPQFAGKKVDLLVTRIDDPGGPQFHLTRTIINA